MAFLSLNPLRRNPAAAAPSPAHIGRGAAAGAGRAAATDPAAISRPLRLGSLWIAYLLAMLFHVDLGLMPLFHGLSAEIESQVPAERLGWLFWAMLIYFLIPVFALLRLSWAASEPHRSNRWRGWRRQHFWISVVYSVTNLPHLVADILVPDSRSDQVALMAVLLLIGLLINREAWAWWREPQGSPGA